VIVNRRAPLVPASMTLCIGLFILLQACHDRRESFYPALGDAISAGEITRGWIPDVLPESSHAIHIIYDPSSPRTWCAFEFSPDDSKRLRRALTNLDILPSQLDRVDGPGVPWWPDFLKGKLDAAEIHNHGFAPYVIEEPNASSGTDIVIFAIDWSKGRGFFYREPSHSK